MSLGTYGFLPWMRQGLAGLIPQNTSYTERAALPVELNFNGQAITKQVQLIGPGDILGISSGQIVRTEPMEGVYDFESNCLPFIEFYEEDFPWRYTPGSAVNKKLKPWLALVVLKDDEYTISPPTQDGLPLKITIPTASLSQVLHPADEHWAWAHVHVHQPADSANEQTLINNLRQDLAQNPDVAISRLLCSRKLESQTQYTAFLVPAFETGRLAGLGQPTTGVDAMRSSWDPGNSIQAGTFPVYKQWRFGTGALGDFETLARALKPRVMPADLGSRPMDINHPGMGLDGLANAQPTQGMEGALSPVAFAPPSPKNAAAADTYTQELKALLNLSADMQLVTFPGGSTPNPFVNGSDIQNDPVVVPPMYGQWHADNDSIGTASPEWLQELNLDPRYRAAAGLGAQVVRDRQEQLMEAAWKQVGEVMLVNDKIAKARMAIEASRAIYSKHFIGKLDTLSATGIDNAMNSIVKTGGLSFKNVRISDSALSTSNISASKAATVSNLTKAGIDSGLRKITRSRSNIVERAKNGVAVADINKQLASKMNSNVVKASQPLVNPAVATQFAVTSGNSTAAYSTSSMSGAAGSMVAANAWTMIYYGQIYAFRDSLAFLDQKEALVNPPTPAITAYAFVSQMVTAMDPEIAITNRVKQMINLQLNGGPHPLNNISPVMAYPVIDEPMYDDLVKISSEYLLPNLGQYPNNTVTLLSTNNRFIEAYMAGLNHEFAKELLWREYPTDQRGSYFRRFWDINDTLDTGTPDYLYDIKPMHLWPQSKHLGENHTQRHTGSGARLVLLVRGDLLKKYPNAMVYAQKGADYTGVKPKPRALENATDSNGNINPSLVKFPIFKASLQPDVVLLGFDLSKEEALGLTPSQTPGKTNAGWFFVFRERPGQVRFGLDEAAPLPPASANPQHPVWDDLSWKQMDPSGNADNVKTIRINSIHTGDINTLNNTNMQTGDGLPVHWGDNSAIMAWILYQDPVMVAIHADDMIAV